MNNNTKKLVFAVLTVASLSGCATTRPEFDAAGAMAVEQVSRPLSSYGSMGGYRYRRFVAVGASAT